MKLKELKKQLMKNPEFKKEYNKLGKKNTIKQHERFLAKIEKVKNGCWNWTASKTYNGYGQFYFNGKRSGRAHRYSYIYFIGEIPENLTIDHQCNNRGCVNPKHLKVMTIKENVLRGNGMGAQNARKIRCKRGHLLLGNNLGIQKKKTGEKIRYCKKCQRILAKIRNNKKLKVAKNKVGKEHISEKECKSKFHICQPSPKKPCMCDCHR